MARRIEDFKNYKNMGAFKEYKDGETVMLDGTLEDNLKAAREFCGLKPGQSFQDIEIPPEWEEYLAGDDDDDDEDDDDFDDYDYNI